MSWNKRYRGAIHFISIFLASFFLCSCDSFESSSNYPLLYPNSDATVYISVLSQDDFSITNNSNAPIYYQTFPTELLPLIDWAPCESKEICKSIQILPNNSITLLIGTIRDYHSESISIFWWQILGDQGEPKSEFFTPQLMSFLIP